MEIGVCLLKPKQLMYAATAVLSIESGRGNVMTVRLGIPYLRFVWAVPREQPPFLEQVLPLL